MISKKSTPASILSEVSFIQAARQQIFWCLADRESWPTTNSIPSDLDLADYSLNKVDQVSNQDNPRDFERYHYLRDGDRWQRTVYIRSHHSIVPNTVNTLFSAFAFSMQTRRCRL